MIIQNLLLGIVHHSFLWSSSGQQMMARWEKIRKVGENEVDPLGMKERRAIRIHELYVENSSSGVIVIKVRIEFCTRGIFCVPTKPSLHVVSKGQTSIVQLSMEGKKVCFCF